MKEIIDLLNKLQKIVIPPRASSWQTMILLSLFSWFMAFLSIVVALATTPSNRTIATEIMSNMGWIFLIIGFHWWTLEKDWIISGFPIGSWLTGALICLYVYGWLLENSDVQYPDSLPFVSWPLISAAIAVRHKFYLAKLNPRIPRTTTLQEIIVLILINVVMSCWFQFHFVLQEWLEDYPSLLEDNLDRSAFVFKMESISVETSRGVQMLDAIERVLQTKINNRPWPEVRNWLLESRKQLKNKKWPEVRNWLLPLVTQEEVKNEIKANFPRLEEDPMWYIDSDLKESASEYELVLKASWRGPRSRSQTKDIRKICKIRQTAQAESPRRSQLPALPPAPAGLMRCKLG